MHPLREKLVAPADLYLDPNNPRFSDSEVVRLVPESRVHEDKVQERALVRMREARFDIEQLEESIRTLGFVPVDRLVVIELPEDGKYMVIEGNRRLAALKSLLEDDASGEITLSPDVRQSISQIPVLVIEDDDKASRAHIARVLQGVRHLSSVKQWGPYQQAQLIAMMLEDGNTTMDIKEVLGLSTQRINSLRRVYYAIVEMREDPDYGADAKPSLFSHFEEALKIPTIRAWLGWNDDANSCTNLEHRQMFYSWCAGMEENNGERHPPKITDAKDLRRLPTLMEDPNQFKRFTEDPHLSMATAAQGAAASEPEIDWRGVIHSNINTLNKLPALSLRQATESDVELLGQVKLQCDQLLQMIGDAKALEPQGE